MLLYWSFISQAALEFKFYFYMTATENCSISKLPSIASDLQAMCWLITSLQIDTIGHLSINAGISFILELIKS